MHECPFARPAANEGLSCSSNRRQTTHLGMVAGMTERLCLAGTSPPTAQQMQAAWSVTTRDVTSIACPTCNANRHSPCRDLGDRPMATLHRGRTIRYLNARFALGAAEPHARTRHTRTAPRLEGPGLHAVPTPHPEPWRLPLPELTDLINTSFFDLAKVVTAHACGLQRTGLDALLYGPDFIRQSLDALTYALHHHQLRAESETLAHGPTPLSQTLVRSQQALRTQMRQARKTLKQQRLANLNQEGLLPFSPPVTDARHMARAWLGRYLAQEKEALVTSFASAMGVPETASRPIRSIRDKIPRALDNHWLHAPVTEPVKKLLDLDDVAFRSRVCADAGSQNLRDDNLCHPLVLNRWRDELTCALHQLAPSAQNPSPDRLCPLPVVTPRSTVQIDALIRTRQLFAALVQRRDESIRLLADLTDMLTITERRDPSYSLLKQAGTQAYDELVRRHRHLYQHIRTRLAPYETRYQRLDLPPGARATLRREIFAELDRLQR